MIMQESPGAEAGTLRERKKQHTRRAIHEAALQLIDAHGLDDTTINEICESANISPRTFFNYYPSKVAAALALPETVLSAESVARFRAARGQLVPALCNLIGTFADHTVDRKAIKHVIAHRPELAPELNQWMTTVREQLIQVAQERTNSRDTATRAVALVMTGFILAVHDQSHNDTPFPTRLKHTVDQLVAIHTLPLTP